MGEFVDLIVGTCETTPFSQIHIDPIVYMFKTILFAQTRPDLVAGMFGTTPFTQTCVDLIVGIFKLRTSHLLRLVFTLFVAFLEPPFLLRLVLILLFACLKLQPICADSFDHIVGVLKPQSLFSTVCYQCFLYSYTILPGRKSWSLRLSHMLRLLLALSLACLRPTFYLNLMMILLLACLRLHSSYSYSCIKCFLWQYITKAVFVF